MDDIYFRVLSTMWRIIKTPLKFFIFKLGGYWLILAYLLCSLLHVENSSAGSFVIFLGFIMMGYHIFKMFKRRKDPTWGLLSSRLKSSATKKESKILDPDIPEQLRHKERTGVFFGEKQGNYVCQQENLDGHVLVLGGSGSGKSTCCAIPSVRAWGSKQTGNWKHTMFVIDIKKELEHIGLSLTQRKRTKIFNPCEQWDTCGFDPFFLARIRKTQGEVLQDISDIAWAIIPESHAKDPYWDNSARDVLIGVLLYCFRVKQLNFIDALEWLADHSSREVINEIVACDDVDCRRQVLEFVESPDNTLGSIWGSLMRPIKVFYQDEMIKNALRKEGTEGMSPQDLEDGWNVICQIPENKLEQWRSVLTLMINQFLKFFEMRDEETRNLREESILFLIDEAPRMGKLRIKEGLTTLRSKGIHIVLCAQGISQFRAIYGKDDSDTILANCSYKYVLSANDTDSQKWLSSLAGKYDKQMVSHSKNQRDLDPFGGSGTSFSEQLRDIIPPETFGELPNTGQAILFNPHNRYCRVNKIPWYKDPTWKTREQEEEELKQQEGVS